MLGIIAFRLLCQNLLPSAHGLQWADLFYPVEACSKQAIIFLQTFSVNLNLPSQWMHLILKCAYIPAAGTPSATVFWECWPTLEVVSCTINVDVGACASTLASEFGSSSPHILLFL